MLTLTCCQDHILTENIWFVWSETSYSGDKMRCYNAGRTNERRTTEDRATQPMEAGGWVSQFLISFYGISIRSWITCIYHFTDNTFEFRYCNQIMKMSFISSAIVDLEIRFTGPPEQNYQIHHYHQYHQIRQIHHTHDIHLIHPSNQNWESN